MFWLKHLIISFSDPGGKLAEFIGACEAPGRCLRTSVVPIPPPRVLLPLVYRIWAVARRPLVRQWVAAPGANGAEVPGRGADEAAWHLALEAECLSTDPDEADREVLSGAFLDSTSGPLSGNSTSGPGRPVSPTTCWSSPCRCIRGVGVSGSARRWRRPSKARQASWQAAAWRWSANLRDAVPGRGRCWHGRGGQPGAAGPNNRSPKIRRRLGGLGPCRGGSSC